MAPKVSPDTDTSGLSERNEPKYDPTSHGPIKNRGCTDCICCILFLICFLAMIAVAALGFARGDPVKLLYPTDSSGNMCGSGQFVDKPNLFFFDLLDCAKLGATVIATGCPTPQVCVKTCPDTNWAWYASLVPGTSAAERAKMVCKYSVSATTSSKVCIDTCPTHAFSWVQVQAGRPSLTDQLICRPNIDPAKDARTIQTLVEDEDCAAYYVTSSPVVGRCIPSIFNTLLDKTKNLVSNTSGADLRDKLNQTLTGTALESGTKYLALFLNAKEYGVKVYQDVRAAWWMILVALGLSMIISLIWIIIMRWVAGPMVWLSLICFVGLFGFATYYCINKYIQMKDNPSSQFSGSLTFTTNLSYYWNLAITWLIFGCISGGILLITLILLIFLRKRILIAIALIKEASRAVGSMIFTLFFPIFPFIFEVVLFAFWGASAVYLASSGTASYTAFNKTLTNVTTTNATTGITVTSVQEIINDITSSIDCAALTSNSSAVANLQSFCNFVKYGGDQYTIYLQFFQLFMLFWCMNFVVAFGQMVLAGSFASYYWAFNKPADIPTFPLAASMWRTTRYHLGTIAFGSLIIAIIQMIRVFLEYLDHKLKGSENPVAKFFLKCLKCCFWCLEKFMKFLNKNAYIMCAVYGKNFCISAKNAFFLIIRNIVRTAVVDKVTDFLLLIGKLFVVGVIGTIAYVFFSGTAVTLAMYISAGAASTLASYTPSLNLYLVPVIILFWLISSAPLMATRYGVPSLLLLNGDLINYVSTPVVNDYVKTYVPPLNNYLVPVVIICVGSYVIAAAFFSVYGMAVDTLFLCFLEDIERHDGSEEKPYYMSKELMRILDKKNKHEKEE